MRHVAHKSAKLAYLVMDSTAQRLLHECAVAEAYAVLLLQMLELPYKPEDLASRTVTIEQFRDRCHALQERINVGIMWAKTGIWQDLFNTTALVASNSKTVTPMPMGPTQLLLLLVTASKRLNDAIGKHDELRKDWLALIDQSQDDATACNQ